MELVLVYDVDTKSKGGQKRLRRIAKICEGHGQRVQWSVFEMVLPDWRYVQLVAELRGVMEGRDNIRIYALPQGTLRKATSYGAVHHEPDGHPWVL